MGAMFSNIAGFTKNIGSWNSHGNVTGMTTMFFSADAFTRISAADYNRSVIEMNYMFAYTTAFRRGTISSWVVGNVTNMNPMFQGGAAFDQGSQAVGM